MFQTSWYFIFLLFGETICSAIRSYDTQIVSFSTWPENGILDMSKVRMIGRERLVNGTFILKEDLDNDHYSFSAQFFSDAFGDGNFKPLPYSVEQTPICDVIKKYRDLFVRDGDYGLHTDLPIHNDTCPLPKGTYYLKNIKPTSTKSWPAIIPRGYIRGNGSYYRDNEVVGTYSLTGLISDKLFR